MRSRRSLKAQADGPELAEACQALRPSLADFSRAVNIESRQKVPNIWGIQTSRSSPLIQSPQEVIVNGHAADAAVIGQHSGLRLDPLRRQDAMHRAEQGVAAHQIQISTQLFHTI